MVEQDAYKLIGGIYDLLMAPVARQIQRRVTTLFPPQKGMAVLDVCCGTGTLLGLYQKQGCLVAGVDNSPSMVAQAGKKLGSLVDLRLGSAEAMPFPSGCFDLVTLVLALHEMPARLRPLVLQECIRVCKPEGYILLADYGSGPFPFPMGWIYRFFALVMEVIAGKEHFTNFRDFMAQQGLPPLIAGQGLKVARQSIPEHRVMAFYLLQKV